MPDDGPGAQGPAATVSLDLDWRSIAVFLGAFVVLAAFTGLVRGAGRSLTWLAIGSLLALALDPLVSRLKDRLGGHRGAAVAVVLSSFLVGVLALVALFGPPAVRQARHLSDDLPKVVDDLSSFPIIGPQLRHADARHKVETFINDLPARLSGDTTPVERAGRSVLSGALAAIVTLLATTTLLLDGERLLRRLRRIVPEEQRPMADRLGRLGYRLVGQYFAGSVLVAAITGVVVAAFGLLLHVPLAPLAGTWVAVFDLIPQIGGALGGIPFVLLALTRGGGTGVVCAVFFVVWLQVKHNVLSPMIVGRSVDLSPPATMTAALVGLSAAGVVGALVAVPLLGAAKAFYLELRPEVTEPVVGDPAEPAFTEDPGGTSP